VPRPPHRLAYQSRAGPVRWIGPGTGEVLAELGAAGERAVVMVPVSFVSDHIETSFELDILFQEVATRHGITTYRRAATFNDAADFAAALARIVAEDLARA